MTPTPPGPDPVLEAGGDPAGTLALLQAQQRATVRAIEPDARLLYGTWGLAWVVGFGTFWFTAGGPDGAYARPGLATGLVFFGCIATAVVVTAVHSARAGRGVRGVSAEVGAMYGWSWLLGFVGLAALFVGLTRAGAGEEVLALLAPGASCVLVGVLYLAGGAIWRDRLQFGLGVWILLTTSAGVVAGLPWIYLVMAVAGGGGFLLAAGWFTLRGRR